MWYLVCEGCGERVLCVDTDEFVQAFADVHVPHLREDEFIEVVRAEDMPN